MAYDYATLQTAIATLMPKATTDPNFIVMFPRALEYADNRINRELNLISSVRTTNSTGLTAGNRNYTFPSTGADGIFVTATNVNVITPALTAPDSGTRNPLIPVTKDYLDLAWPNSTGATLPRYFAPITQTDIIVGPWPDAAYTVEVTGTVHPLGLSSTNTTTFLTTNLPDLYFAAVMESVAGWMKDYSAQSDDPGLAISWSREYDKLFASANAEELRKRFYGPAWTSLEPTGLANPQRN